MPRRRSADPLHQAFDAVTFGPERTLNLRAHQPTRSEAMARTEAWLRERQVTTSGEEVLVITGRGLGSVDGVSVVREGVLQMLASLRRRNVIAGFREHTPGSFVVELAPVHALFAAPRRRKDPAPPPPDPRTLTGLDPETRALLRTLATVRLQHLGVHSPTRAIVEDEMLAQYGALARSLPDAPDREAQLQQAVIRALEELDG